MAKQQTKHSYETWQKSRMSYEKDGLSFREIETLHGIANSTLSNRAKNQQWQKGYLKDKADEAAALMRINQLIAPVHDQETQRDTATTESKPKIKVGRVGQEAEIEQTFALMVEELRTELPNINKNQRNRIVPLRNLYSYLVKDTHALMVSKNLSIEDGLRYLAILSGLADKIQKIENDAYHVPKRIQLEFVTPGDPEGEKSNLVILPSNQREDNVE